MFAKSQLYKNVDRQFATLSSSLLELVCLFCHRCFQLIFRAEDCVFPFFLYVPMPIAMRNRFLNSINSNRTYRVCESMCVHMVRNFVD